MILSINRTEAKLLYNDDYNPEIDSHCLVVLDNRTKSPNIIFFFYFQNLQKDLKIN